MSKLFLSALRTSHGQILIIIEGITSLNPLLNTAFVSNFNPKVTGSLVARLGY